MRIAIKWQIIIFWLTIITVIERQSRSKSHGTAAQRSRVEEEFKLNRLNWKPLIQYSRSPSVLVQVLFIFCSCSSPVQTTVGSADTEWLVGWLTKVRSLWFWVLQLPVTTTLKWSIIFQDNNTPKKRCGRILNSVSITRITLFLSVSLSLSDLIAEWTPI